MAEHLLDRGSESRRLLLALLEVLDRQLQPLGLLLDLAAAVADQRVDRVRIVGGREQRLQPVADPIVRGLPAGPVLPLTICLEASPCTCWPPNGNVCRRPTSSAVEFELDRRRLGVRRMGRRSCPFGGLSGSAARLHDSAMDTIGARHLAARLRAGVPVGTTIVLERDDSDSGLARRRPRDRRTRSRPTASSSSGSGASASASTRSRRRTTRSKRRSLGSGAGAWTRAPDAASARPSPSRVGLHGRA